MAKFESDMMSFFDAPIATFKTRERTVWGTLEPKFRMPVDKVAEMICCDILIRCFLCKRARRLTPAGVTRPPPDRLRGRG